jgi:SOS-response transcriptional repressor LexA
LQANKRTYKFPNMNTLADRMKLARKHGHLTQKALAVKAGVEQPVISQLETGKNLQSAHLAKLAHVCGVSAIWLSDGIGEMLSGAGGEALSAEPSPPPYVMFRYPVISWESAGTWDEAVARYPAGLSNDYELSDYTSKGPAFWLEVKGDSMTSSVGQSVPEGSLILVDTEAEVHSGKLVVAKLGDCSRATFKKLVDDGGRRFLKPLNGNYPMEAFGPDCRIIGVVVRALMKF